MSQLDLYNLKGEKEGKIKLPATIFDQKVNLELLAQAVHIYRYNQRKFNAHTKKRGEVSGGGSKPWRQKGTGRARHGSSREPQWRGGGIVFGPRAHQPRTKSLPKKMRRLALLTALSLKKEQGRLVATQDLDPKQIKTSAMRALMTKLPLSGSTLLLGESSAENLIKSVSNIPSVTYLNLDNINVFELLKYNTILLQESVIKKLTEQFASQASIGDKVSQKPAADESKSPSKQ